MTPRTIASPWRAALLVLTLVAVTAPPALAEETKSIDASPVTQAETRRVDVNLAGEAELLVLPQVGPVVARRIVDYRQAVGPFKKVEELLNVKGIGRKTLERLRPLITLGTPAGEEATPAAADSRS